MGKVEISLIGFSDHILQDAPHILQQDLDLLHGRHPQIQILLPLHIRIIHREILGLVILIFLGIGELDIILFFILVDLIKIRP
jgi:hypothetical protein